MYVQETGRGGRDDVLSNAILYYNKRDIAATSHATEEVKRYCENMSECHRALLMRQFTDEALDLPLHRHSAVIYVLVFACVKNVMST